MPQLRGRIRLRYLHRHWRTYPWSRAIVHSGSHQRWPAHHTTDSASRLRLESDNPKGCGVRQPNLADTYQSVFRDALFANRVNVVTGGGSGIGRCTAHELACLGATLDCYPQSRQSLRRSLRRHVPLRRMGIEAEVSAAIVFLLSPADTFISGTILQVDGAARTARRHAELPEHDRSPVWNGFHRYSPPPSWQADGD
jgi:Enoyl-(Acyl carrier protein) reductase